MAARIRRTVPSTAQLRLSGAHAAEDLAWLGWDNLDSLPLLWTLAGAGDPDLALNTMRRLSEALGTDRDDFDAALRADETLRVRLLALLGGSTALGDHLVANPGQWRLLAEAIPEPEELMRSLLGAVDAQPCDASASTELSTPGTYRAAITGQAAQAALKRTYRTLLMRIAAADLAGTFASRRGYGANEPMLGYPKVTSLLSALADAALTAALAVAVRSVYGDDTPDSRLAVLALGKCGATELNYISDVDVVFVSEPVTSRITRVASELMRLGSACFFEVDANLRPEGRSGALTRTLDSHVAYYRRWAQTWEFQALLKARPMTGDLNLGADYVEQLAPLVWAASQRESFVEDVQAMRTRVVDNVPAELRHRELKLGRGGLRDVEFAVQLLQLVHGRSDESLRVRPTTEALGTLINGGYVGREDGQALIRAYEQLRLLEHRLQLTRLRRTHALPEDEDHKAWEWLANASGYRPDPDASAVEHLYRDLKALHRQVSGLHKQLFYRPLLNSVVTMSVAELRLSQAAAQNQLAALGYRFPDRAFEHLTALASGNSRKAKLQAILLPTLMEYLASTADPDAGLLNYRKLSEAAFDRTWFLRMLRDEGVVAQRLMFILGTSPYTADLLISAPDAIKQFSDGATGPKLLQNEAQWVYRALIAASKRHKDPDKAVSRARELRRLELARIASADLLGFMDTAQVCEELSVVWLAVLEAALRAEVRASLDSGEYSHPPARIAVIGMGRLGGRELGYGSDADVMVVAEPAEGVADSDAVAWAIGVIERMRKRLSTPSDDPALDVDLGLRPEGRSGPIVRTIASYERYYQQWGETWEIQALQRAAHAAGDEEVGQRFLRAIDPLRYPARGASAQQVRDVRRMKARVDNERLPRGADRATHTKLGRGALTDIEWTVQLITLEHAHEIPGLHTTSTLDALAALAEHDDPAVISAAQVHTLSDAWLLATRARNAIVLVRGKRKDQLPQPGPELAKVSGAAGWGASKYADFLDNYLKLTRRARNVVDEVFWGESASHEYEH
ncbi:bifunctional [glutamine synthetase] adenylyltransferase/[glutamine synthetase]-adenylyl-L-tyrosine phosphorylase [Corynebacterium uterequi]|uniref:Glutamine synthetase adenylyltransferase n=1 Tax=Corynebacterium uterequi TaxID=1072256 RepID=A0A0G3HHY4_9CORY|nr:bifunctional [glutamine synthetase] adenylyltransferase/[glutamine synthetase]-adenylyl-L-tyrosine phosphorylase [Corynebacterium uterequi]AKK11538.1 glutamine synthetase adenylyltransferase [Corynebacterium uterequi]